jgi:hypothetical protein
MSAEHPEDALPDGFIDEWLDRRAASTYLATIGVRRTRATLAKLCSQGRGPPWRREGGRPLYSKRALHWWGIGELNAVQRRTLKAHASDATA